MSKLLQTLQTKLDEAGEVRERVDLQNEMAFEVRDNDPAMLKEIAEEALEAAQKDHYLRGEGFAKAHLGYYYSVHGDRDLALQHLEGAQKILLQLGENEGVALTHLYYSLLHYELGELNEAMDEVGQAMKYTHGPNSVIRAWSLYLLGMFYSELAEYEKALNYLQQAIPIFDGRDNEHGLGRSYNALSKVYLDTKKLDKAQEYGLKSLKIHRSSGYAIGVARSFHDLGVIALEEKAFEEARYYLTKSLEIRRDSENFSGVISTLTDLGQVFFAEGHYQKVVQQAQEALELARSKQAKGKMDRIIRLLVQCYTAMGMLDEAVAQYESLFDLGAEQSNKSAKARIQSMEHKFETEMRKQEAEIHRLKNVALKKAHTEIQDSLYYARRMQAVFLPQEHRLKHHFPNSFAWFQPREVLSGDFHWLAHTDTHVWFAVADSTGRGVPSAMFASVVIHAINFLLHEARKEDPSELLQALHEILYVQFNHEQGGKGADHLDITLCRYQRENRELTFAGANQSLYLLRQGAVEEFKTDKHSLGESAETFPFAAQSLTLQAGDCVYLVTDGLSNQFGGDQNQKLMKKGLREMLEGISVDPMAEQGRALNRAFRAWKGVQRQVDDICALGIEF